MNPSQPKNSPKKTVCFKIDDEVLADAIAKQFKGNTGYTGFFPQPKGDYTLSELLLGAGNKPVQSGEVPFTPSANKVLVLAKKEARELCHEYVGAEHLLLGIMQLGTCKATALLRIADHMSLEQLRELVRK